MPGSVRHSSSIDNVGTARRGFWADKGCAYLGLLWLFGTYCRRYRWSAIPRFLLVVVVAIIGQAMVLGATMV